MSKTITFSPKQYPLEGRLYKNELKRFLKGTEKAWNKHLTPAVNVNAPFIRMAVAAKSKNPKVGQVAAKFPESLSGQKGFVNIRHLR